MKLERVIRHYDRDQIRKQICMCDDTCMPSFWREGKHWLPTPHFVSITDKRSWNTWQWANAIRSDKEVTQGGLVEKEKKRFVRFIHLVSLPTFFRFSPFILLPSYLPQ